MREDKNRIVARARGQCRLAQAATERRNSTNTIGSSMGIATDFDYGRFASPVHGRWSLAWDRGGSNTFGLRSVPPQLRPWRVGMEKEKGKGRGEWGAFHVQYECMYTSGVILGSRAG